jgi:four helix bundle protein
MGQLGHAKSFRDLMVCKKARSVAGEIFELTRGFPREEIYSLTDQVRRSSRSVGAQIAEASK